MSDVRSLLKAKRQEIRIDHPLASYTPSGQLRCVVCETNIKHPSAWDGHLGSKAHRTNTARIREEERKRKEQELEEETKRLKRKVPEDDVNEGIEVPAKKPRAPPAPRTPTSSLPSDFFSDPSRALFPLDDASDDEDDTGATAAITPTAPSAGGDPALDEEWIQFQHSVVNAPDAATTYDRATIFAEPELVSDRSEGFPTQDDAHAHALPVQKVDEDERRRKHHEERELIMDRLIDEERAQEEADMKVTVMKTRLTALRKRREASRSANVGVA